MTNPAPSKVFKEPLRNFSGKMTDERALEAIALEKTKRPDLWSRFTEHEKTDEGYGDINEELSALLMGEQKVSVLECVHIKFELRKQVRREADLPL